MGSVALSIAGSFAGEMIPSAPPGFGGWEHAEGDPSTRYEGWWDIKGNTPLVCLFVIFFSHSLWVNYRTRKAALGKRTARILANLRGNWFSIIIGNAIGAWAATLVMGLVPNFSVFQMFWDWLLGLAFPVIRQAAIFFMGASNTASVGNWISWYHANYIKLAFWVLYLAGTLDDLGVPNIKTVARWAWRRFQKRKGEGLVRGETLCD